MFGVVFLCNYAGRSLETTPYKYLFSDYAERQLRSQKLAATKYCFVRGD